MCVYTYVSVYLFPSLCLFIYIYVLPNIPQLHLTKQFLPFLLHPLSSRHVLSRDSRGHKESDLTERLNWTERAWATCSVELYVSMRNAFQSGHRLWHSISASTPFTSYISAYHFICMAPKVTASHWSRIRKIHSYTRKLILNCIIWAFAQEYKQVPIFH